MEYLCRIASRPGANYLASVLAKGRATAHRRGRVRWPPALDPVPSRASRRPASWWRSHAGGLGISIRVRQRVEIKTE